MSITRSSITNGNADEAARLAKRKQNRNHYNDNILAGIYPAVPQRVLQSDESDADDVFAYLPTSEDKPEYVERVKDYANYKAMGFNSDVQQLVKFQSVLRNDGNEQVKRFTHRYLGVADGPDTGPIFGEITNEKGATRWNPDGTPMVTEEPIGRWTLDRAPVAECKLKRSKISFSVELNGEIVNVPRTKVHGIKSQNPFCFLSDLDSSEMDPNAKIPALTEEETWTEDAQIVELEGRFFAYRNLVGIMTFDNGSGSVAQWPVVNTDSTRIASNRQAYSNKLKHWESLTSAQRRKARFSRSNIVPRGAGIDCYLLRSQGVLDGKNNAFIEIKKTDGGWKQIPKSSS